MNRTRAKYSFQIQGLTQSPGTVKWATLVALVDALRNTAMRATRLVATGSGRRRGAVPAWLRAAVDLEMTGLRGGSTVIELTLPTLGAAARDQFSSGLLWGEQPDLEDTAFDLATRAVSEVLDPGAPGDLFDHAVLDAAKDLASALPGTSATCRLERVDNMSTPLEIGSSTAQTITERISEIPMPRPRVVTGILDEIGHRKGQFQLRVASNSVLRGEILREYIDVEALRDLWGHEATVEGKVHYRLDGMPRKIEAQRITTPHEGDAVFRTLPTQPNGRRSLFGTKASAQGIATGSLPRFEEAWPGEETLEELLADLD